MPIECLTSDRIYYIRSDGSDSNDGLSDSPEGAFKTLQYAYDRASSSLFLSGFKVTFKIGAGEFYGIKTSKSIIGSGEPEDVLFEGKGRQYTSIIPAPGNSAAFHIGSNSGDCRICIRSLKISAPSGYGILVFGGACAVHYGLVEFGACGANHVTAAHNSWVYQEDQKECWISGSALSHLAANTNAVIAIHGQKITFLNAVSFSGGFVSAAGGSRIYPWPLTAVNGGYCTGPKFSINYGSTVSANGDINALPGTANSFINNGGYYL